MLAVLPPSEERSALGWAISSAELQLERQASVQAAREEQEKYWAERGQRDPLAQYYAKPNANPMVLSASHPHGIPSRMHNIYGATWYSG